MACTVPDLRSGRYDVDVSLASLRRRPRSESRLRCGVCHKQARQQRPSLRFLAAATAQCEQRFTSSSREGALQVQALHSSLTITPRNVMSLPPRIARFPIVPFVTLFLAMACASSEPTSAPPSPDASNAVGLAPARRIPNPRLVLDSAVAYSVGPGFPAILYDLSVRNWSLFPDALFAQSPDLPPCGSNTLAARSWVDIYDETGARLFGFCALGSASDLNHIYAPVTARPTRIYITITDRLTGDLYTSNMVRIPAP